MLIAAEALAGLASRGTSYRVGIAGVTLATRIAVMKAGELLQLGTPKEIYENPADLFVAGFMGSPSMNLIPARLVGANGGLAVEVARAESGPAVLPLNGGNGAWAAHAGKDVILGVRPEHISDPTNAEAQGPEHHRLDALVEVTEPTGPDTCRFTWRIAVSPSAAGAPGRPVNAFLIGRLFKDTTRYVEGLRR